MEKKFCYLHYPWQRHLNCVSCSGFGVDERLNSLILGTDCLDVLILWLVKHLHSVGELLSHSRWRVYHVMRCAIWYHLYNLKHVKNTPPWVFFTCSEGSFMYSIDFFNYNHFVTKIEFMKEFANFLGEQGFLIFILVRVLWIFDKPFFIYCFFKLELKLVEIVGKLLSVTLLLKGKSRNGSLKPSKEIAFIWFKNHVVLWKPFRYYRKIMSKGAFTCKQDKFHQRIKLHPKMKVFLFTCSIHSGTKNVLFA